MGGGTGQKFAVATTITAGTLALLSTLLSIISIWFQLKNYRKPLLQRYVVRILLMVPIYAISSWVSMVSLTAASFLDPIRDIYEAFTIYTFFQLLLNYLDGERALIIMTHGRAPVHHLWPLNHLLSKVDISDPHTFLAIKRGVLQYAWLKPILALSTIIMKATGTYQEGYIGLNSGYLWSGIVYNISVSVSLYALGLFWVCMHDDLIPFRPVPKFLCVKLIIFASYWQGFFLSILVWLGAIPDDVEGYTSDNLAAAIQDALICCEMPLFAIAHWYAFSWHDYANNTVSSARLPVKFALRDAFGIVDLIIDSKLTFQGDHYNYRKFDSSGNVIAHEDSNSRFARMKEGMRYSRGGEAKYWIPKPGEIRSEADANTPLLGSNGGPSSSNGTSRSPFHDGTLEETSIDKFDERLFAKARELEFGDFNYPAITANIPSREIWRTPAPAAYQASSGAWQVGRTTSSTSVTNRLEPPNSPPSAEDIAPKKSKKKGKQREEMAAGSKPKKERKHKPEPAALAAQHEQTDGPLGAPHMTTSEPQILEEEAEVEEDVELEEEEAAREEAEEAAKQRRESTEEQGIWTEAVSPPVASPAYESGNDDAFKNVWGGGGDGK